MKHLLFVLSVILFTQADAFSQQKTEIQQNIPLKYMQITTIESVVGAGLGRSKMIITKEDGSQEERDLENLFSLGGINFKNIRQNETSIINTLKNFTDAGWKLQSTIPLTLSPNQSGNGIFMTRYLLIKE